MAVSIPMPLIVCVEDVGWWSGKNGSLDGRPFRTGMGRDHLPEDYLALEALGKGLGMRIPCGFVLCEWDREGILKDIPTATWQGRSWAGSGTDPGDLARAAEILRGGRNQMEICLHGVGHEFWGAQGMERTEFHTPDHTPRTEDMVNTHLDGFFRILAQYGLDSRVRLYIPPALNHSFGCRSRPFHRWLSAFGISFVLTVFNKARMFARPQHSTLAWEDNVLVVERGEAEIKWDRIAAAPAFGFNRPVLALHWANILAPDPGQNLAVVDRWVRFIRAGGRDAGMVLSSDLGAWITQYLHHCLSKVVKTPEGVTIETGWMAAAPGRFAGTSLFLDLGLSGNALPEAVKIAGAAVADLEPAQGRVRLELEGPVREIRIEACASYSRGPAGAAGSVSDARGAVRVRTSPLSGPGSPARFPPRP